MWKPKVYTSIITTTSLSKPSPPVPNHREARLPTHTRPNPINSFFNSRSLSPHSKRHLLLDLGNGQTRVEPLGARPRAVENRVAAVQAHRVVEGVLALLVALVARVDEPAVRLQQDGRAQVLLRVPPVRRARGRAARAQDALVQPVELLAVGLALAVFLALMGEVSTGVGVGGGGDVRRARGCRAGGRA